ncbi:unnamed protein product [Aphanomyces euteiches]
MTKACSDCKPSALFFRLAPMSESHENVNDKPICEEDKKDFNTALLEGMDLMEQEGGEDE